MFVRGWLHGNVVQVGGSVVDTGYHSGTPGLLDFLGEALPETVVLTHVHADHAGGVAALQQRRGCAVFAHADAAALVQDWDTRGLWLVDTGQELPRFRVDATLAHGDSVAIGGRPWTVLHTPGHATGGLSFFDAHHGLLITGDALWERGFGLLDPWVDGEGVFEAAAQALAHIAEIDPCWVIPGHGPPFSQLAPALDHARSRLDYLERNRDRLLAQVLRNGLGFAMLARPELGAPGLRALGARLARRHGVHEERQLTGLWAALGLEG